MRTLSILVLSYELPPLGGGGGPIVASLSRGYADAGHQVTIVTMHFEGLPYFEVDDLVEIHRVPSFRQRLEICHPHEMLCYLFGAATRLEQLCRRQRFDVCHTHFIVPTGPLAWWLRKRHGIPYILTAHGSDIPGYNPDRFKKWHRFTPPFLRLILRSSACLVSPSEFLLGLANQKLGACCPARVIPNTIDSHQLTPAPKKPIILSSGRLLARKGFGTLLQAVREVELPCSVHICGDGPERERLQSLAAGSKTEVIFHGWLDNRSEKYRQLLAQASIYVLMSTHENASVSLLEALLAGCAVVTSNVTGCPETVGSAGVTLPPNDPEQLRQELVSLLDRPERVKALAQAGRQRALSVFAPTVALTDYLQLLESSAH